MLKPRFWSQFNLLIQRLTRNIFCFIIAQTLKLFFWSQFTVFNSAPVKKYFYPDKFNITNYKLICPTKIWCAILRIFSNLPHIFPPILNPLCEFSNRNINKQMYTHLYIQNVSFIIYFFRTTFSLFQIHYLVIDQYYDHAYTVIII